MKNDSVKCPHCGNDVDVQELLRHEIEENMRFEYQSKLNESNDKLKAREAKLIEREKEQDQFVKAQILKGINDQKNILRKQIETQYEEDSKIRISLLEEKLKKKNKELEDSNKLQLEYEELKFEKNNLEKEMELKFKKELNAEISKQRDLIKKILKKKMSLN